MDHTPRTPNSERRGKGPRRKPLEPYEMVSFTCYLAEDGDWVAHASATEYGSARRHPDLRGALDALVEDLTTDGILPPATRGATPTGAAARPVGVSGEKPSREVGGA